MDEAPLVLVTGISGYIASWTAYALLECGYRVRGTVRSLKDERKVKHLRNLHPKPMYPIELVEADLLDESSWPAAVKDADYIMHLASPFVLEQPKDPQVLIKPAVDGTLNVLKAAASSSPRPKRVVVTSSVAAVAYGHPDGHAAFTESDWTDVTVPDNKHGMAPYVRSKALAEKAAWEFVSGLPEQSRFELATVCPVMVQGTILGGSSCGSADIITKVLLGHFPAIPSIPMNVVDVRDVVLCHMGACFNPKAAGLRFIAHGCAVSLDKFGPVIAKEFAVHGYPVPTGRLPDWVLRLASYFDATAAIAASQLGDPLPLAPHNAHDVLGITFNADWQGLILGMARSIVANGIVADKSKGKALSTGRSAAAVTAAAQAEMVIPGLDKYRLA